MVSRLRAWQPDNQGLILSRGKEFPPQNHHHSQISPVAHPTSYSTGPGGSFLDSSVSWDMKVTTHLHILPKLRMHGATHSLPHVFMVLCFLNTNNKRVDNASGTTSTNTALLTLTATDRGDNGVPALTRVSHWLEHWETNTSELVDSGTSWWGTAPCNGAHLDPMLQGAVLNTESSFYTHKYNEKTLTVFLFQW